MPPVQIPEELLKWLELLGWVKETYLYSSMTRFVHKDYAIKSHQFWIEMKLSPNLTMAPAVDCEVIEHGPHGGTLFKGYLETKDDLMNLMRILYIFRDDRVVDKYLGTL